MTAPRPLELRDRARGRELTARLERAVAALGREVTVMHVCGSHEQAMARYGLRQRLPRALRVQMGPGCPVCVTDAPEIDDVIALANAGLTVLTYGDMLRVPGSAGSLDDARAAGAKVELVYSATEVVEKARASAEPVVFFATGFETTAVATAAILRQRPTENLAVYSAHKWVPAAMDVVARTAGASIEGYLAAGHAATITGDAIFAPFVAEHRRPVVVAGFEPLDLLAALVVLVEEIGAGRARVVNAFARCVRSEGNRAALAALAEVFSAADGTWRGIAHVRGGELRLAPAFARWDATVRYASLLAAARAARAPDDDQDAAQCRCGAIMTGVAEPTDCPAFGARCTPRAPLGACMVSSEGPCRIWLEHGVAGAPRAAAGAPTGRDQEAR